MDKRLLYTAETTLEEVVEALDRSGVGFLALVDQQDKLVGIVTDGDIRKAILRKAYTLDQVINRQPVTMPYGTSHLMIRHELQRIHRNHMPVVDEAGVLKDIVILNDFDVPTRPNWVVIMAGGMGTRLGDLTKNVPKPMLEISGKPILEHIIDGFIKYGFEKFILCVNYKAEIIENYFGSGEKFGINIEYTYETKRLGTAGALSLIGRQLSEPFFVVNGDVISSIDLLDFLNFHQNNVSQATMCVKGFSQKIPFACVEFNDKNDLTGLKEKPDYNYHINAGMYILNPETLTQVPKDTFYDMPNLFIELVENGFKTKVFRMDDYWIDIGRPSDYERSHMEIGKGGIPGG